MEQGGRTGLTALAAAALFLLALFFSPMIDMIGSYRPITAPALVVVGTMMMRNVTKIDWGNYAESLPDVSDYRGNPADVFDCRRPGAGVHRLSGGETLGRPGAGREVADVRDGRGAGGVFRRRPGACRIACTMVGRTFLLGRPCRSCRFCGEIGLLFDGFVAHVERAVVVIDVSDICHVTPLGIVHLDSLDALRATAEAWDDLWRRSDATLPSLRAELLAQWVEHFARPEDFHAVAVEAEGRLVAALPLVRRKIAGLLDAGTMPCNEWSASGDLLLDSSLQPNATLCPARRAGGGDPRNALAAAVARRGRAGGAALAGFAGGVLLRAGMTVAEHPRWQVGRVEIDHDWPAYKARWSRKHRQKMAWSLRRLAARGKMRLAVYSPSAPDEAAAMMRPCFEIEDRGWKGAAGTSVLRTPGMAEFFTRQAELAARCGPARVGDAPLRRPPRGLLLRTFGQGRFPFRQDQLRSRVCPSRVRANSCATVCWNDFSPIPSGERWTFKAR